MDAISASPIIEVNNFTFRYPTSVSSSSGHNKRIRPALDNFTLHVPQGSRVLVVGANGSGKTTLLRSLAGKHVHEDDEIRILSRSAFRDTTLNNVRTFISSEWGQHTVAFAGYGVGYAADIAVGDMMKSLQQQFPERRDRLLSILAIDPQWRMHKISDGQRRRVQIFLCLLRPSAVILMDEVTAVLDLLVRRNILNYLKEESEKNQVTILYATNVIDGLESWLTDILYIRRGRKAFFGKLDQIEKYNELAKAGSYSPLLHLIEWWLTEEEAEKGQQEAENREVEGGAFALEEQNKNGYTDGRLITMEDRLP